MLALDPLESRHASRVLRMQEGDSLELLDGHGECGLATMTASGGRKRQAVVQCRIDSKSVFRRGDVQLHLLISPPRARLMTEVVRMASELGVARVTPALCERSVARPDAGQVDGRWLREAVAAAKQSGNVFLPELDVPCTFAEAVELSPSLGFVGAVPRPGTCTVLPEVGLGVSKVAVWIGPEGGFSEKEEAHLSGIGMVPLTVGQWVLRVETAVGAMLGQVIGIIGNDQLRCECV